MSTFKKYCPAIVCAVCCAWLLAYGLLWGFTFGREDGDSIKKFCENSTVITYTAGAFTMLAALIVFVLNPKESNGQDLDDKNDEVSSFDAPSDKMIVELQQSNERLKQYLTKEKEVTKTIYGKAAVLRDYATSYLAYRYAFWIAIYIAIATGFGAVLQSMLDASIDYSKTPEPFRFIAMYANSLLVLCSATVLGFHYQQRFARRTKRQDLKFVFMIGFTGVLATSLISILTLSPDLVKDAWPTFGFEESKAADTAFYHMPYFQIPMLAYLFASKIFAFPVAGFLGGLMGRRVTNA